MEAWKSRIKPEVIEWLLEEDEANMPVRFLTLRDILNKPQGDKNLEQARDAMMNAGLIPAILSNQLEEGYWENGQDLYYPKYTATIWQMIALAQMGADGRHPQIKKVGEYVLQKAVGEFGGFSLNGRCTGSTHCLQGNIAAALMTFGFRNDPRLRTAMDWMARSVTGEGFSEDKKIDTQDYYVRSAICGPGFQCSANEHQPCAWGAIKVALALSLVPPKQRSPSEKKAVELTKDFLLAVDPVEAGYPHPYAKAPSLSWFKLGFPIFYITDVLQNLEALTGLDLSGDKRLNNAIGLVLQKQDQKGRWKMEYSYNGKTWAAIEERGKPSKWVSLRAVRVIKNFYG